MSTPALSEWLLLPAEKEVRQKAARMMQEVMKAVVEEEREKLRQERKEIKEQYVGNYKKF